MQDPQKTPHCVSTETVALLALGGNDNAQDLIHISQCAHCSALLRDAIEDLHRDPSPEELALAESIPVPKRNAPKTVPRWPLAIAAALFVLVSASAYRLLTPTQQTLTAQLSTVYATHRTMDLRFDPSGYAPVRLQRSESHKSPYAPLALAIAEALEKQPNDPALLRDKGRLALFEGRYDEAISILEGVVAGGSADGSVQTDIAAAYFQRGLQHDSRKDREEALARYQEFARNHPSDVVAAFNLAVTAASTRPSSEAIALFEKYLALESSPQWKQEAERRLAQLREGPDRQ